MAIDKNFVVGFYVTPKIIEVKTGEIVKRWAEIFSGRRNSSINIQNEKIPPTAIDLERKRFAVADENFIHVLNFS